MNVMYEEIREQARRAMTELLEAAKPVPGSLVVVGCSSSEIMGANIGKGSTPEAAQAVLEGLLPPLQERGLYLAVCVRPRPKAGGSFATAAYEAMRDPVAVEHVRASAGLDIGNTLIGMHLKDVAVPLRLSVRRVGEAWVNAARTRPKLIGGARAEYPPEK